MFSGLTEKMQGLFARMAGKHKLTEENISDAVREVRLALLEADVNYSVTKTLVKRVKDAALGEAVMKAVEPGQQFIKIIHDELVDLMGKEVAPISFQAKPTVIMLCGLQGSGKTTHAAKLAHYFLKKGECRKPMLAACDLQRPAAIEQLSTLGKQLGITVFSVPNEVDPVAVAKKALEKARHEKYDLLILDTAGRLHIDEELMGQLERVKEVTSPHEILFVANAATGQDAVNIAAEFSKRIEVTGTILTMLDGNTRAGAAISIREVTGKPLKFEGIGEKVDDIQPFNPSSMADRILGMGDTINLVRRAEEHIDKAEAEKMEKKIRSATFTYEDYLKQMQMVKKMGSFKGLLKMLPGMNQLNLNQLDESELTRVEAIIQSMTVIERTSQEDLAIPRRKRVARGSGTSLDDVNRLIKSFKQAKQFFKNMPNMNQLQKKMTGGSLWR